MTSTATHRVFEAIQGLWPVTLANVREADPQGLLDIFEGADNTRDAYFANVTSSLNDNFTHAENAQRAGESWADWLSDFDTDHTRECDQGPGCCKSSDWCSCKKGQWLANEQWGQELYNDIQQRITELNG